MPAAVSSSPAGSTLRIGTPQHFRWLHGIVKVVLVLNLLDAVFTLLWVWSGLAKEANPLLRQLVLESPVGFAAAKLAVVGLASLLLWRLRERPLAVVAIFLAFLAYYALLLAHIGFLSLVLGALWFG
jgi:hypothetical protein